MKSQTEVQTIIIANHDATNRKLLQRIADEKKCRYIDSSGREVMVCLHSPEAKRLYLRCFAISQRNLHYITAQACRRVPIYDVERIGQELLTTLDARLAHFNQLLASTEAHCQACRITSLAEYDVEPLSFATRVFSALDLQMVGLIEKVDLLILMLGTLRINEAITVAELAMQKSQLRKAVHDATNAVRVAKRMLHRRANSSLAPAASPA